MPQGDFAPEDLAPVHSETAFAVLRKLLPHQAGTHDLGDGRIRVVCVGQDHVDVREYRAQALTCLHKVCVCGGKAQSELTRYDAQGRIVLEVRAEVDGVGQAAAESSSAMLQRDIRWYSAGRLIREMYDTVNARVGVLETRGPGHAPGSAAPFVLLPADSEARVQYSAVVQEYLGGRLATLTSVDATSSDAPDAGGALSTFVIRYDESGRQTRESAFSDALDPGRGRIRRASDREADDTTLRRDWGQATHDAAPAPGAIAPGALTLLGLTGPDVGRSDAVTAGDLLSLAFSKACARPGRFARPVARHMADKSLEALDGDGETPFRAKWTGEISTHGRLTARREDTFERTTPPPAEPAGSVRAVLHACGHLEEVYDETGLVRHARSALCEEIDRAAARPAPVVTRARAALVGEEGPAQGETVFADRLQAVDDTARAALDGLRRTAARILGEVAAQIDRLGPER